MTKILFTHRRGRTTPRALPLVAALSAIALAGCVTVTQPKPPQLDLPEAPIATAEQNALLERWWVAFDDPVLTALIEEAFANNLDLRGTLARIEAARADVLLAQSYLYPSVNGRAGFGRSRPSQSTAAASGFAIPVSNDYSVGVEMSYELDIWGKYRSGALAAANDLVGVAATTARRSASPSRPRSRARISGCAPPMRLLVVFEDTRRTRADTVQLQQDRFDGGIIGEYDLAPGRGRALRRRRRHRARAPDDRTPGIRLATLTGRSPREVFTPVVARGASIEAATVGAANCRQACRPDCSSGDPTSAASSICSQRPTCASRKHGPIISRA